MGFGGGGSATTAVTQAPLDNSTKIATTAYNDAAVLVEKTRALAAEAGLSAGMIYKAAAQWATTVALPANVYANGASGVGATLTGVAVGALTVDGGSPAIGDAILVKNEAAPANNGPYVVTASGSVGAAYVLTRRSDYNVAAEMHNGDVVGVLAGSANTDTSWVMTTTGPITVGTTAIAWSPAPSNVVGTTGQVVVTGNVLSLSPSAVSGSVKGNRISFVGDSTMTDGGGTTGIDAQGWPDNACILSGGRMILGVNAAASGATSYGVISSQLPQVLADPDGIPAKIVVGIGTNDIATGLGGIQAGITPANTRANIATIVATIRGAGSEPVLCTIPPRSTTATTGGSVVANCHAKTETYNAWLKEYCLSNKIQLIDVNALLVNPATNEYPTGWSADGIHPGYFAINYISELVADRIGRLLPAAHLPPVATTTDDATNLLGDGLFLTNPGGLPTGWTLASGSSNFTGIATTGVGVLGDWLKLSNTSASPGNGELDYTVSTGFSPGDKMAFTGRVGAKTAQNSSGTGINFTIQAACFNASHTLLATFAPINAWRTELRGRGVFYEEFTVPASTASIVVSLIFAAGQGYIQVGQLALRDLTTA